MGGPWLCSGAGPAGDVESQHLDRRSRVCSSDRNLDADQLAETMVADDQLAAVSDAVGCERVAVFACSIQGPTAIH